MPENYFQPNSESQNFIDYFKAVNPTFLNENVKALYLVKANNKVYLKSVFTKEEYLNKYSYTTNIESLDMVVTDCDCDENPDGKLFFQNLPNEQLIDLFVNLDEECFIQIFEDALISVSFLEEYYEVESI